jgi:hypothetical protein
MGVFVDFDEMIRKLEAGVQSGEIWELQREMVVTRVEVGCMDQDRRSCHLKFTKEGKAKFEFGWDTTMETLRAP